MLVCDVGTSPSSNIIGVISYTPSSCYLAATGAAILNRNGAGSIGDDNGIDLEWDALTSPTIDTIGVIAYTPATSFYFEATGVATCDFGGDWIDSSAALTVKTITTGNTNCDDVPQVLDHVYFNEIEVVLILMLMKMK